MHPPLRVSLVNCTLQFFCALVPYSVQRNEVLIGLMMEPATGQSWDECRPSIHPNSINNGPRSLSTCPSPPLSNPRQHSLCSSGDQRVWNRPMCFPISLYRRPHFFFITLLLLQRMSSIGVWFWFSRSLFLSPFLLQDLAKRRILSWQGMIEVSCK